MELEQNSWGKVHEDFEKAVREATIQSKQTGMPVNLDVDNITKRYIDELFQLTGRPVLIYVTDFFNGAKAAASGNEVSIVLSDKDGIVETTRNLPPGPLDVILHSPG